MSDQNFARSAPANNFVPPIPKTAPQRPKMLPPSMDLPPSFQKPSIFDDADALVALTGKVPGSEMAASYVDPGILNLLAADPDAASTKPIAMNSSLGPAAGATGGIPGGVQNPPKRVVARSLTNNTPSFIAAASCPNDDFLSKMNAETVRKAQNMSMGRSPTILSTINGLSSQMGDLSLNSNAAGASKEGSAPQQFSSRARASILLPPQPRVADVAEEEDEDEDEDEDEGDDVDGDVGDDDELTFGM